MQALPDDGPGTGAGRPLSCLVVVDGGHDDAPHVRIAHLQLPTHLDAVTVGEADVEHNDVGLQGRDGEQRLLHASRFADHAESW